MTYSRIMEIGGAFRLDTSGPRGRACQNFETREEAEAARPAADDAASAAWRAYPATEIGSGCLGGGSLIRETHSAGRQVITGRHSVLPGVMGNPKGCFLRFAEDE